MRKINLILLLLIVLLLSGCDKVIDELENILTDSTTNIKIADVIEDNPKSEVTLTGTISLINETGFIFTDGTASIFVNHPNATDGYTKGDTVKVKGSYRNEAGHELYNTTVVTTNVPKELSVPTNLVSSNTSSFINSYNGKAEHIRFEAVVKQEDGHTYLQVGDKNFAFDSNATKANDSLKAHLNKKY